MRVWLAVESAPGLRTGEIRDKLGNLSFGQVKDALQWLREYGCVENKGTKRRGLWYSTGKKPIDMRGSGLASLANLKANAGRWGWVVYRKPLMKPNRAPPIARPTIELERCWPILGVIRQRD